MDVYTSERPGIYTFFDGKRVFTKLSGQKEKCTEDVQRHARAMTRSVFCFVYSLQAGMLWWR